MFRLKWMLGRLNRKLSRLSHGPGGLKQGVILTGPRQLSIQAGPDSPSLNAQAASLRFDPHPLTVTTSHNRNYVRPYCNHIIWPLAGGGLT